MEDNLKKASTPSIEVNPESELGQLLRRYDSLVNDNNTAIYNLYTNVCRIGECNIIDAPPLESRVNSVSGLIATANDKLEFNNQLLQNIVDRLQTMV